MEENPMDENPTPKKNNAPKWIALAVVAIVVIGAIVAFFVSNYVSNLNQQLADQQQKTEEAAQLLAEEQLRNQQIQLTHEYDELSASFVQHEGQVAVIKNDSLRAQYEATKNKVEELRKELKNRENLSQKRINELKGEIESLKKIMRHYVEQIDELNKQNEELRKKNESLEEDNRQLATRVESTSSENKVLNQRMQLAEKLNVTGVSLTALNKKGKNEKNVTKAKQLKVSFTIPQNNSTPVGKKTIYLRLTSPEGNLLSGNGISFPFEGTTLQATAQKSIEYEGNEIPGITIYWDVNTALNPGSYRVELFCDNYRLASRNFELTK